MTTDPQTPTLGRPLTETERTMLRYALDQAQEHIWSRDGFTDEDQAAVDSLRRLADEAPQPEPPVHGESVAHLAGLHDDEPAVDAQTLADLFEGFGRLLATSSRDWGQYRVDAWLYAVILGWDCEETAHDETCTHGAMEEMQRQHGWSDEAVAKARRYRAAVRALTQPAADARQDRAQS